MGSHDSMGHPQVEKIKVLGERFERLRSQLSDFRVLTNRKYLNELLAELDSVRQELIAINGAKLLDDGSLIIKTEVLVPFLNPKASELLVFANRPIDLMNPDTIRRIALNCNLEQWNFLSKRLPTKQEQMAFIRACVAELKNSSDKNAPNR